MNSTFLSLNTKDFIKGLAMAVLTAIVTVLYNSVEAGSLEFNIKSIVVASLSAALAYIIKNALTNSEDQFLKKETK
jgi:uncharacterized membrane protein